MIKILTWAVGDPGSDPLSLIQSRNLGETSHLSGKNSNSQAVNYSRVGISVSSMSAVYAL